MELSLLQRSGEIHNLTLQPKYDIVVNGTKICKYIGDFLYWDCRKECRVLEDVKSVATRTPAYVLKKKLMLACYDIKIVEV